MKKIFNIKYLILILPVWLFLLISPLSFTEAITFVPITPPPGTPVPGACQSDTDCPSTEYCAPPSLGLPKANCQKKKAIGEECSENRMCLSNVCETGQGGKKYCVNPITGEGKVKWQPIAPKLQINIPTWTPFTSEDIEKIKQTDEEGNVYIPFIGLYIAAVYRWAVGIAALIAVVFVIMGGLIYMTAGGNAQRAQEGKDRISHALFGLLLLLGSYALLYTINPDLVRFKSLKVKVIERMELAENIEMMKEVSNAPPCTGPNNPSKPSGIGDTKYLGQLDNFACGTRDLSKIKFVVLHEGGKNSDSTFNIFQKRSVSSHYSIDRDGKIFQLVGEERRAWHAGAINAYSIGIDLSHAEGCPTNGSSPNCTYTNEMIQSLNQLINGIAARTGVAKSDQSIIGHCQVGGTTHIDPRNFDWNKIGLNNSAHYENPNDLTSKCKIVFNLEEYKKTQPPSGGSSSQTGCCYQQGMGAFSGSQNQCSLGTFYAGSCSDYICCGLAGTMTAKECLGKGLSITGSGGCQ